jgi:acetyltransferase-like isoleucine patch superfamily enzyme
MKFNKIIIKIAHKIGKNSFNIDNTISFYDLLIFVYKKFTEMIRGEYYKFFFNTSKGFIFVGNNAKISYKHKISSGKNLYLGDNINIQALCKKGINFGDNVTIQAGSIIDCMGVLNKIGEGLNIGHNVGIAQNCFIQVRGSVKIGNNVIIGPNVSIFSENHNYTDKSMPISKQGVSRKGVIIEDGVWIGTRSVILDGVIIEKNSIIAAGSVVNKNVEQSTIVGGVPAKIIKFIN